MRYALLLPTLLIITLACRNAQAPVKPKLPLITQQEAERIIGEAAQMTDSVPESRGDTLSWRITYTAQAEEQGRRGNIYFMLEKYPIADHAHSMYAFIKKANMANGVREVDALGDEAYFHTDGNNFYFMLVRKGPYLLRMKVNRITKRTSEAEFRAVTKEMTERL